MKQTLCLFAAAALIVGCATPAVDGPPARGDSRLSDFYAAPDALPAAGTLLRQEALSAGQSLDGAARNIRLLYSSTDGIGGADRIAVSGALFLPAGDAPKGGWPTVVWSHGTVGIGDVCAPSANPRSERDAAYLNSWLAEGYAVLASDYQGLGTPGAHPYMAARPMAYSTLDIIRAARSGGFGLSDTVLLAGQSQGAAAAIAAAGFAGSYAPDLDIAGLMVTGIPYFTDEIVAASLGNADPDASDANLALSFYSLTMADEVDPDFDLDAILSERARPVVKQADRACVWDFIGATMQAGLTPRNSFTADYAAPMRTAFSQMTYPTVALDMPVFTGTGAADRVTPAPMQVAFVTQACAAGTSVVSEVYPDANHNAGLGASIPGAQAFAKTVLAGGALPKSSCG
jgi:dienelactone hydrolase